LFKPPENNFQNLPKWDGYIKNPKDFFFCMAVTTPALNGSEDKGPYMIWVKSPAMLPGNCGTVNPFDRSLFSHFANSGILAKWLDKVFGEMPNRFAIQSCGIPIWFKLKILK